MRYKLQKGFKSINGQIEIVDEDRLCYVVKSVSKGACGLRTISKNLLDEYVEYFSAAKNPTAVSAREDLSGKSEIDKFEYGYTYTLSILAKMVLGEELSDYDKILSEHQRYNPKLSEVALQVIYYGAPGTGKSHKIDNDRRVTDNNTIRTTFHPDSDYSTFVGAYKPTMENVPMSAFVGKEVHLAQPQGEHTGKEKKIVYKYVPQAFLKAYVAAWSDLENPHFLVIEEINRGNCAQIFGDLFQLLDRNNMGSSSYAIHADEDIAQFLSEDDKGFAKLPDDKKEAIRSFVLVKDSGEKIAIGEAIHSGEKLLLPPNLCIWATMNTSDQSLFPIDSAFKRRWNWEYMPIDYNAKDWQFEIGDKRYMWSDFLQKINPLIYGLTGSSDKQMGYFFAKADKKTDAGLNENNLISEQLFLNKVLFYIWTDVLKDFETGEKEFQDDSTKKMYRFCDFFPTTNGKLAEFVGKLELEAVPVSDASVNEYNDATPDGMVNPRLSVTFPGGDVINTGSLVSIYMRTLQKIGFERAAEVFDSKGYKNPLISKNKIEFDDPARRYHEMDGWYILCGPDTYPYGKKLEIVNDELNLGLDISYK